MWAGGQVEWTKLVCSGGTWLRLNVHRLCSSMMAGMWHWGTAGARSPLSSGKIFNPESLAAVCSSAVVSVASRAKDSGSLGFLRRSVTATCLFVPRRNRKIYWGWVRGVVFHTMLKLNLASHPLFHWVQISGHAILPMTHSPPSWPLTMLEM